MHKLRVQFDEFARGRQAFRGRQVAGSDDRDM